MVNNHAGFVSYLQALADERDRELTQTWQQLRELQAEFRQLQLDSEAQIKTAKEAQEVSLRAADMPSG